VSGDTLEIHPITRPTWASGDPLAPAVLDAAHACHVSPELLLHRDATVQARCGQLAAVNPIFSPAPYPADVPSISDPHEHACENPTSFVVGVGRDVYFGGRCYFRAELNSAYACHISPAEFRHMTTDQQNNCMMAGAREAMATAARVPMTAPTPMPAATPFAIPHCGGPLGLTHGCVSTVGATTPAYAAPVPGPLSLPPPNPYAPFLLAAIWALGGFVLVTGLLRRWTGW
jgi:hypothetical protein